VFCKHSADTPTQVMAHPHCGVEAGNGFAPLNRLGFGGAFFMGDCS